MVIYLDFDDYVNKLEYPSKPSKPTILRKSLDELSDEEIENARLIKKHWMQQVAAYDQALLAYKNNEGALIKQFQSDLWDVSDIGDKPLHNRIYQYAWDKGHDEGLRRVADIYEEIMNICTGC